MAHSRALPARHPTRSWQRSYRAGDVLAQRVRLALDVVEPLLDHVADAGHAAQPAVLPDHRDVTDAPVGHQRHEPAHSVAARAGEPLLGHHAALALAADADHVAREAVLAVPGGQDAAAVGPVPRDPERADPARARA